MRKVTGIKDPHHKRLSNQIEGEFNYPLVERKKKID